MIDITSCLSAVNDLKTYVNNCFAKCTDKGSTFSGTKSLSNLEEAIDSGELTEADYNDIVSDYYREAGYHWEFISEAEYLDNQGDE